MSVKFIIQFGRSKVSLFVFHASKEVWLSPWLCLSERFAKLFWVILQNWRGKELLMGLIFWRYWTAMYHSDFSWSCGYSRFLVDLNISLKFNQSLWNYIFISHEMHFFALIIFSQKAIKWCMKGREVTALNSKGLRDNNLNYKDQFHSKWNSVDSEIPYYNFYKLLLLVFLILT